MKKSLYLLSVVFIALMVSTSSIYAADWCVPGDYDTIQQAISSAATNPGDTIYVYAGDHAGANITKKVNIVGLDGAAITSGPPHSSGMVMGLPVLAGGGGSTITHLKFEVDLPIMNRGAVNNVTVSHCEFINSVQAVTNWRGSGWNIEHNDIVGLRTRNGGGIGILIGDYMGGTVKNNSVAHNKISGILTSMPGEKGGYSGSGIVLYADFRWGGAGSKDMSSNRVVHNKVDMVSESSLVDIVALELTDTRDDPQKIVVRNNAVGFNDFRDTFFQIALTPDNLDEYNSISRNLGENRGHGLHPSLFR